MRLPWLILAATLMVPSVALADAPPEATTLDLYAHWPGDVDTAMQEPIPLTPLFPYGQPDLADGPLTPGSSTLDTVPTFTYTLVNPDGTQGPAGDLDLDPRQPLELTVYLSADHLDAGPNDGDAPVNPSAGLAPEVTVHATLTLDGDSVSTDQQTRTLLTANEPIDEPVTPYTLTLDHDQHVLPRQGGLEATFSIHQVDDAETLTQPGINLHTGEAYPTGLTLPILNHPPDETLDAGAPLDIDALDQDPEATRNAAGIALAGSLTLAAMAGARIVKQIR